MEIKIYMLLVFDFYCPIVSASLSGDYDKTLPKKIVLDHKFIFYGARKFFCELEEWLNYNGKEKC